MRLTNLTWPKAQEYFEKNDMVLISIGSIECHGAIGNCRARNRKTRKRK